MEKLHIPFALDDQGNLYSPITATKGKNYFCPACQEPVILKKGKIRTAHFTHKSNNICNQETIIHQISKLLIQKAVHDWKLNRNSPPIIQRNCQICRTLISQPLPEKVENAILEYRLKNNLIVDIALLVKGEAKAAIEIRVTHAVDEIKAHNLPIPFIELNGYEIIDNPNNWKPIIDRFNPLICDKCKSIYKEFKNKVMEIAKISGITLPTIYYRYGVCKCWKCNREIIVFAWPKDSTYDNSIPKAKPLPKTIQKRYSRTANTKYWANTCPYCHSTQGNFFLYSEPDGPFFTLHIKSESKKAFQIDLMKIAEHAKQIGLI